MTLLNPTDRSDPGPDWDALVVAHFHSTACLDDTIRRFSSLQHLGFQALEIRDHPLKELSIMRNDAAYYWLVGKATLPSGRCYMFRKYEIRVGTLSFESGVDLLVEKGGVKLEISFDGPKDGDIVVKLDGKDYIDTFRETPPDPRERDACSYSLLGLLDSIQKELKEWIGQDDNS